ncbi:MAG: LiaF domain-containing protein [Actinomycetota bacterium]
MPQIVGGGVLILIGLLWLLERLALIDISVTAVFGLATMVTGISLMLLARDGPHGGLVVLGTILALVTLITATAPFEGFQGGIGDRTIELTTVDDIAADYNLAMGKLTIDLSQVNDLRTGTSLSASVGMGDLIVRIPEGTDVAVNARVGAGELEILDRASDGLGIYETYRSPGLNEAEANLVLDLEMFTGHVEVTDE